MNQRIINVAIHCRDDGGVLVYSDDMPDLGLCGKNRAAVLANIEPAVRSLLERKGEDASNIRIDAIFVTSPEQPK